MQNGERVGGKSEMTHSEKMFYYLKPEMINPDQLYDGVHLSWNAKLDRALKFLVTRWVLHPRYTGKHRYNDVLISPAPVVRN